MFEQPGTGLPPATEGFRGAINRALRLQDRALPASQQEQRRLWEQEQQRQWQESLRIRYQQALHTLQTARFVGPVHIASHSSKGGVGKTTTAANVAITWGVHRRIARCVVVDANAEPGTLSERMGQTHGLTLQGLAQPENLDRLHNQGYEALVRLFGWHGEGVMVIASDVESDRTEDKAGQQYTTVVRALGHHLNTIFTDCGTNISSPLTRAVLDRADVHLLVTEPLTDSLLVFEPRLQKLAKMYPDFARRAIIVVNNCRTDNQQSSKAVAFPSIAEHLGQYVSSVWPIGHDPALEGGEIIQSRLHPVTQLQYLELVAAIAQLLNTIKPETIADQIQLPRIFEPSAWMAGRPASPQPGPRQPQQPPTPPARPTTRSFHPGPTQANVERFITPSHPLWLIASEYLQGEGFEATEGRVRWLLGKLSQDVHSLDDLDLEDPGSIDLMLSNIDLWDYVEQRPSH